MKKSIKHIFNTLLFASCLTFFSCNNLFQNDEKLQSVNTLKSENKVKITANIDLGNNSRKAVPEDYSLYDSLNYKLIATCNTDDSYSTEMPFDDPEIELELVAANWSFELTAYDAANTPILRSSENTNIDITEDTELNFKMVGIANGVLEYDFSLPHEEEELQPYENPVLVFEVYRYNGSIQNTINVENKLTLSDENYTNKLVIIPNTNVVIIDDTPIEITVNSYFRSISINLPEGKYIVICKKADRNEEDPIVNEETVTEDNLSFFFQELVEIKAGLTTKSGYDNIYSASPEYKITFHTNGGSYDYGPDTIIPNESYCYRFSEAKKIYKVIPEPEKANNVFQGWFYDSELTKPFGNPHGDGLPLLNENVGFLGNIELYAKWVPINGEKPEIMLYSMGSVGSYIKEVKYSSDWNTFLNSDVYGKIIDVVSNNDGVYSLQNKSESVQLFINNEEPKELDFLETNIERLAVDDVTNKVYLLLWNPKDGGDSYKQYSVVTYDGEFSEEKSLGTALSETGVCYPAQIKSFNVNNGTIWLSFHNYDSDEGDEDPDQKDETNYRDYISLLYICTPEGEGYSTVKKSVPNLLTCLDGTLSELKYYSYITDLAFKGNKVYATVKTSPSNSFYDATSTDGQMLYFGGIVEIDPDTFLSKSLFAFDSANIKTFNYTYHNSGLDIDEAVNYQYMGVNSQRDTTSLAGPTKILAIKEEELIMVDEGAFAWVDKAKGYHTDVNRIVVFDLQTNSLNFEFG